MYQDQYLIGTCHASVYITLILNMAIQVNTSFWEKGMEKKNDESVRKKEEEGKIVKSRS
jgi:hypothetical protein